MPKHILGRLVALGVIPLSGGYDGDVDLELRPSSVMVDGITLSGVTITGNKYNVTMTREQLSKAISLIDCFSNLMEEAT